MNSRAGSGKWSTKSTILGMALQSLKMKQELLPKGIGKYTTGIDKALTGKHIKKLYDIFRRLEAPILAQLRTGMARVNQYLHRIGASESDHCSCGQATGSIEHLLFRCTQWNQQRHQLFREADTRRACLSFFLTGRAPFDSEKSWAPNMPELGVTAKYAIATERPKWEPTGHSEDIPGSYRQE